MKLTDLLTRYCCIPNYFFILSKNNEALSCPLLQNKANGKFNVPASTKIDKQLIIGSAFFGLGWGIAGLCPVSI